MLFIKLEKGVKYKKKKKEPDNHNKVITTWNYFCYPIN